MPESKLDLLQGTLDLMVLQTLAAMGSLHGYGIARRIEQVSGDAVLLNQGTIYASLVRLQQQGWISAAWGTSDNNRKAKFYSITKRGRKQLSQDAAYWQRLAGVMGRVLALGSESTPPFRRYAASAGKPAGSPRLPEARIRTAGSALRRSPAASGSRLYRDGRAHAGPRHRGQHGDFLSGQRRFAAALALPRRWPSSHSLGAKPAPRLVRK